MQLAISGECIARMPAPPLVVVARAAHPKIDVGQEGDEDQRGDQAKGCHEATRLIVNRDDAHSAAFRTAHHNRA